MQFINTIQEFQKLGEDVVKEGKRLLRKKPSHETSNNTLYNDFDYLVGSTKDSVFVEWVFGGAEDYWSFVDQGVKGSGGFKGSGKMRGEGSPYSFKGKNIARGVIAKWINYKPLKLRNAQGRFIEKNKANIKSAAFLIGRAIAQRGLTRTRFFSKPYQDLYNKNENTILESFADDIEVELKKTFK